MTNMQSTSLFKRLMSAVLAVVLMLGLVPNLTAPAYAAPAPDGMPEHIKLRDAEFSGIKATSYTSPNGLGTCWLQHFAMDIAGTETYGFCYDHSKLLNSKMEIGRENEQTWTFNTKVPAGAETYSFLPFLDYYVYCVELSEQMDREYPDLTEAEKLEMNPYYLGVVTRSWVGGWVQSIVWLFVGKKFTNVNDPAQIALAAKERDAVMKVFGFDVDGSDYTSVDMLNGILRGWREGKYGQRSYYLYYPTDTAKVQPVLVPEPRLMVGSSPGYLKVLKVDTENNPLSGAEFTVYRDSNCTKQVGSETTGSDGVAIIEVTFATGSTRQDFWVKETKAPAGYKADPTPRKVTVDANANSTPETAAAVNGGQPIKNSPPTPPHSDSAIQKVDAATGEGVGPATFHFEGQADDPATGQKGAVSADYKTDDAGALEIQ
ncbi:SpaA isopeptide-forming pilin-related protein, partial [uncultured Flavonifractor sp.]|uniref:SpaA isopeptide-forming pilin-related protein n=1 Tax=uncultured Flavonifractor sp. TaxID=1193534 RepID=UPI00259A75F1